jgi:SSS family solute:Na+ symporter
MNHADLHIIDWAILGISLLIPLAVSLKFIKRQDSINRYFKAGSSLPAWAIGISILATLISSVTFLAYPGSGFSSNWILLVQGLMVPVTLVAFIGFLVPLYRKIINLSAYEYFEQRFGFLARLYSSLGFFLAHFSKMGTVFFLIALAFSKMTGIDTMQLILILGALVIFITLIGGIEAVIWLDVIQGFLLVAGGIVSLLVILFKTPGGFSAIWQVAGENGRLGFGPFDLEFVNLTFVVMALNGIFYAIQKYGTDQTIVQRYLTARSDRQAIKASLLGVFLSVVVWALFMFIGTALFGYYELSGEILPAGIRPDAVFPLFIINNLPVGVVGLVLAALLAAAISSLDSDLNCLSAIFLEDYYLRFRKNASERNKLLAGKITVIVAGLASLVIASYYIHAGSEGVLGIVFMLYSIFSGGIAGMFLLGIFTRHANRKGVYTGMLACILFTGWAVLTSTPVGEKDKLILDLGNYNFGHHRYMLGVYSHLVLIGVGYVASTLFKDDKNIDHLTYAGWLKQNKKLKQEILNEKSNKSPI